MDLRKLSEMASDLSPYGITLQVLRNVTRLGPRQDPDFPQPLAGSQAAGYRYDFMAVTAWARKRSSALKETEARRDSRSSLKVRAGMSRLPGLYFVQCGPYIKIGIAQDIPTRISQIKVGNPFPIRHLGSVIIPIAQERRAAELEWHGRWSALRHQGEWFRMSAGLLKAIREVAGEGEVMGSFSVYTYWMKAEEESALRQSGELADVLACLQAGAAWFARRNGKRLCEGPPERRQPGALQFKEQADAQYVWPLIVEQSAPHGAPGHSFRSAMGSRFCSAWVGEHWNGSGAHCGKTAAEHGALLERVASAPYAGEAS